MNHSFIVRSGSIIGRNMSDLFSPNSNMNVSLELTKRDKSQARDDSFFKVGDPEVDMVKEIDVLRAIP